MKIVCVSILAFLLTTCTGRKREIIENPRISEEKKNQQLMEQMNKVQSTPGGNYYKFIPVKQEQFKIEWGNKNFRNESRTLYHFSTNFQIYLAWENKDFIVLRTDIIPRQGWLYYFFPLVPNKAESDLENPVAYQADQNIVVSLGFKPDTVLLVNNILTGQVQPIVETERCWNPIFFQRCIDSIRVTDSYLYYKFQIEREKSDMNLKFERKIPIRI